MTRVTEPTDELLAARIAALGDSPYTIADSLALSGCAGRINMKDGCPLVTFLEREGFEEVSVEDDNVVASGCFALLSPAQCAFLHLYDEEEIAQLLDSDLVAHEIGASDEEFFETHPAALLREHEDTALVALMDHGWQRDEARWALARIAPCARTLDEFVTFAVRELRTADPEAVDRLTGKPLRHIRPQESGS